MRRLFCNLLAVILVFTSCVAGMGFGVTPEDLKPYKGPPLYVLTPPVPKEVEAAAKEKFKGFEYWIHYQQPIATSHFTLSNGFAVFDALQGVWTEKYYFPVFAGDDNISCVIVSKGEDGWVGNFDRQGRFQDVRYLSSASHPIMPFTLTKGADQSPERRDGRAFEIFWVQGKKPFATSEYICKIKLELQGKVDQMRSMIEKQKIAQELFVVVTSQDNVLMELPLPQRVDTKKYVSAQINKTATRLFAKYLKPGEELSFFLNRILYVNSDYDATYDSFFGHQFGYFDFETIKSFAIPASFPTKISDDEEYKQYHAMYWFTVEGYEDPCVACFGILCDSKGRIASAWLEMRTMHLNDVFSLDRVGNKMYLFFESITTDIIIESGGGAFARFESFPISATMGDVQKYAQARYREAGYKSSQEQKKRGDSAHFTGGLSVDEPTEEYLANLFADHGWKLDHKTRFFAMLNNDRLTTIERKQAELASNLAGVSGRIDWEDLPENPESLLEVITPLRRHYLRGASTISRDFNSDMNLCGEGMFYAEKKYPMGNGKESFWIDFYCSIVSFQRYAYLLVTPDLPTADGKYERFIYPINSSLNDIKKDMQKYVNQLNAKE